MNSFLIWDKYDNTYKTVVDIKEVLTELEKKDKIIDLMADALDRYEYMGKERILEYFTNKAVR